MSDISRQGIGMGIGLHDRALPRCVVVRQAMVMTTRRLLIANVLLRGDSALGLYRHHGRTDAVLHILDETINTVGGLQTDWLALQLRR